MNSIFTPRGGLGGCVTRALLRMLAVLAVTGAVGSLAADPTDLPTLNTQPANLVVVAGSPATFGVSASGAAPLTYQWRKNGTNIVGATAAVYSITATVAGDAGGYSVMVSNAMGTTASLSATLTVSPPASPPLITSQPASLSVINGQTASFSVTATGSALLTYQWNFNGSTIAGATSATYSIPSAAPTDAGSYTVTVTNSGGSVNSSGATLTVTAGAVAPTIAAQPASQTVTVGQDAIFKVTANGTSPFTYQWRKDGVNVSGATTATLTIPATLLTDAGAYSVVVTNTAGAVTSSGATLNVAKVPAPPKILTQPVNQVVSVGHSVSFVSTTDATTKTWQVSTSGDNTWIDVSNGGVYGGAATGTLTLTGVTFAMDGDRYRLTATNTDGATTSDAATLTVISALLPAPVPIAIDTTGLIYVGDVTSNTIQEVTGSGVVSLLAGTGNVAGSVDGTGSMASFNQPGGLVVLPSGILFVADSANSTIRRITAAGGVTTFAGSASQKGNTNGTGVAATFSNPNGLAVDAAGNLYVADTGNHTIRKVTSAAVVTTFAGGAGASGTADGTGTAARFNNPAGVAVDGAGNVFVTDTGNHTIRKITPTGAVTTFAGVAGVTGSTDGAGGAALFNHPTGLAADAAGFVYVADTGNSTIRRITPDGTVSTLAGLPSISGLKDGTGDHAWLNQPKGLALDNVGNLYVTDFGNAVIRIVSSGGVVTTMALSAAVPDTTSAATGGTSGGGTGGGTGGGGSSGGGGAMDAWLVGALALLGLARRRITRGLSQ